MNNKQNLTIAWRSRSVLTLSFPTSALVFLSAVWLSACPSVAQPAPSPTQLPVTWEEWTSLAVEKIGKVKRYPSESATRHEGGTVRVEFVVDSEGFLIESRVVGMSCYDDLNKEALEMLRRASPLPPFPAGTTEKRRRLVQNIVFRSKDATPNSPTPRTREACLTS